MRRWTLVALLVGFMAINFMDKAVFGLAAVPVMKELRLSPTQFGAIGSSFFALFSVAAALVGTFGNRLGTRWLLPSMALLWTFAQAPLAGAVGLLALVSCRVLLGASEGPAFPTALHAAYQWFPEGSRARITGFILAGAPLGIGVAAVACTWIISHYGWHSAFGVMAILSLIWAFTWLLCSPREEQPAVRVPAEPVAASRVSLRDLMAPTMIGVMIASFASYAANSIAVIWFPAFLEHSAHFSAAGAGWLLAIAWWLLIPASLLIGWLSEALQRKGLPSSIARGLVGTAGLAITGATFVSLSFAVDAQVVSALVIIGLVASLSFFVVAGPIVAEITSALKRSSALGALVAVYALAGLVGPFVMGRIIDASQDLSAGYQHALLFWGSLMIASAVGAQLLMRPAADRERLVSGIAA
jgi:ACS family D-galactonate transporter-like MFS transporter